MRSACEDSGSENVLYGWGKNAPPMSLPQGAGFSVGPGTSIRTVVLQVCFRQQACLAGVSSCVGSAVACSKGTGREAVKRGGDDSLAHAAATATLCVGARPPPPCFNLRGCLTRNCMTCRVLHCHKCLVTHSAAGAPQVHYLDGRPANDTSGVKLTLSPAETPNSAGMVAFAASFSIPPRRPKTLVQNACCYNGWEPLHGFATRVHTHALGRWAQASHKCTLAMCRTAAALLACNCTQPLHPGVSVPTLGCTFARICTAGRCTSIAGGQTAALSLTASSAWTRKTRRHASTPLPLPAGLLLPGLLVQPWRRVRA